MGSAAEPVVIVIKSIKRFTLSHPSSDKPSWPQRWKTRLVATARPWWWPTSGPRRCIWRSASPPCALPAGCVCWLVLAVSWCY